MIDYAQDVWTAGGKFAVLHKFGYNGDADSTTVPEDVWDVGGAYIWPTAAVPTLTASSTADNNGSSGAATVTIEGLSESWTLQRETVDLTSTATGGITLSTTYLRVFRMFVATASSTTGSPETNVGTLTLTSTGSTGTIAQIATGVGQTLMALYTTPVGFEGIYLTGWDVTVGKAATARQVTVRLDMRTDGEAWRTRETFDVTSDGAGHVTYRYPVAVEVEPKTDIRMRAQTVSANDSSVAAAFDLLFVRP